MSRVATHAFARDVRSLGAVVVVLGLMLTTVSAAADSGVAKSNPLCGTGHPLVLGVRGSGETGYGTTVSTAIAALKKTYKKPVDTMSLSYPADSVNDLLKILSSTGPLRTLGASITAYFASVNDGVAVLTSELAAQALDCPSRPIVLIGYSQGALVVNRALVALGAAHNPVVGQIAGVELIADPQRLAGSPYLDGGAPTSLSGLSLSLGHYPADQLPAGLISETGSWCRGGDLVSAPGLSVVLEVAAFLLGGPVAAFLGIRHLFNDAKNIHSGYVSSGEARAAGIQAGHLLAAFSHPTATAPSQPSRPNGQWTEPQLTITAESLGAVQLGMTLAQAEAAAGLNFDGMGDGMAYPTALPDHLYVGLLSDGTVGCVGAGEAQPAGSRQTVSTPEGFQLGDTVQALLSIYGSRAQSVPAPTSGLSSAAGYIVADNGGNLLFFVDPTDATVTQIAGGPNVTNSNSCPG